MCFDLDHILQLLKEVIQDMCALHNVGIVLPLLAALVNCCLSLTTYAEARNIRTTLGHDAAVNSYRELLILNPDDASAAIRIASGTSSPRRQDLTCPDIRTKEVQEKVIQLKGILDASSYNHTTIKLLFGVKPFSKINRKIEETSRNDALGFVSGPIYVKQVSAGNQARIPENLLASTDDHLSSLKCLVTMFLLGFSMPKKILTKHLCGGDLALNLLEDLGLAFPCEIDPSIIVPYVHIFPLDLLDPSNPEVSRPLILVTDSHPSIISRTTVGELNDGAVMYIGPDSLALVQHLPLDQFVASRNNSSQDDGSSTLQILDFCTGSGIQALSILKALEVSHPNTVATCLDINSRALRFTMFNTILNGFSEDRVRCIKADIVSHKVLDTVTSPMKDDQFLEDVLDNHSFDIIIANPPFIPVPCVTENADNSRDSSLDAISARYGLFSSGGSTGEEILREVISLSPQLLRPNLGLMAVVSEFMNPPYDSNYRSDLMDKITNWWSSGRNNRLCDSGLLFVNEYPISHEEYAKRRADNHEEVDIWMNHLKDSGIRYISPGLLYVQSTAKNEFNQELHLESRSVPRSSTLGSIWTPYNVIAVHFTKNEWKNYMQFRKI